MLMPLSYAWSQMSSAFASQPRVTKPVFDAMSYVVALYADAARARASDAR